MLPRKVVFRFRALEHVIETAQPYLPRRLIDFKRKVARSHPGRTILLQIQRRPTKESDEERCGFPGGLLHIRREEMPDLGLLQFLIKIQHHAKDVRFAHDAIDFRIRPGPLGRPSWRRVDASLDHLTSFNCSYDAPFAASDSTGNP